MKVHIVRDEENSVEAIFTKSKSAEAYMRALNGVTDCYGEYDVFDIEVDAPHTMKPVLGFAVHVNEGEKPGKPTIVLLGRDEDRVDVGAGGGMKGICYATASAPTEAEARRKALKMITEERAEIDGKKKKKKGD